MDKHLIVPYAHIARMLKLDERDVEMDTLLVESANEWVKLATDRQIVARDAFDIDVCTEATIAVKEWPIQKVSGILDETENIIDCYPVFVKSDTDNTIHLGERFNGQRLGIVYRGGYEVDEVPAVIVEAVIKLFYHKKTNLALEALGTGNGDTYADTKHVYDEVMCMLAPYTRKRL